MAAEPAASATRSRSPEQTEALGRRLGERLQAGDVVALSGELGSGKTTFVRGVARGLGIAEEPRSPTFVLMQEYEGRLPLYHFDAWMSGREALFLQGGGAEYLGGDGVALVEWAERVEAFLPRPHLWIELRHRSATERELSARLVPAVAPQGESPLAPAPPAERARLERLRALAAELFA